MRHRSMRALTVLYAVLGCVSGTLLAVLPTYAHDRLGLGGSGYGLLLSCFGLGTLSGGMTAGRTVRAFRAGRTLVVCAGTTTLVFVGLAFSSQVLEAALCMVLLGVVVATWTVVTVTLRQRLVPNSMLGRVASAFRGVWPGADSRRGVGGRSGRRLPRFRWHARSSGLRGRRLRPGVSPLRRAIVDRRAAGHARADDRRGLTVVGEPVKDRR